MDNVNVMNIQNRMILVGRRFQLDILGQFYHPAQVRLNLGTDFHKIHLHIEHVFGI